MRNRPNQPLKLDYVERVNRAIDYIVRGLDQPLRLQTIATQSGFSAFHFHRVFRALMGECLNDFVKRLRLERALHCMAHDRRRTLTEIGLACGFSSSSDFSRCFKQRYGVAPSRFDLDAYRSRHRQELIASIGDQVERHRLEQLPVGDNPDGFEVQMLQLPARSVAYLRVLESYRENAVFEASERLLEWAEKQGVADGQWLGYMWDDPTVVALRDCRYDIAVEVDRIQVSGEVGRFDFPEMRVAQVEIRGGVDLEMRALDWFFASWLPTSGHVPAPHPCFEAFFGRPFAHGGEYFELSMQIPVERSR